MLGWRAKSSRGKVAPVPSFPTQDMDLLPPDAMDARSDSQQQQQKSNPGDATSQPPAPARGGKKEHGKALGAGRGHAQGAPAGWEGQEDDSWRRLAGFPLFAQQTRALLMKNFLLALRNRTATLVQLFSAPLFVLVLFCISFTLLTFADSDPTSKDIRHPEALPLTRPIPACTDEPYMRWDCFDFLWTGNTSADIQGLVKNISENNPGRPINFETRTKGFATPEDVDAWLLENPYRTRCAVLFYDLPGDTVGFALQINFTFDMRGYSFTDHTFKYQLPLHAAVEREVVKYTTQNWDVVYSPSITQFAHPKSTWQNVTGLAAALFLFAAACFNAMSQMSAVLHEKELGLRQTMATMGLMSPAYWISWLLWEMLMASISCLLLTGTGFILHINFFARNGFGVVFLLFFLFWMAMTSLAFTLSTFMKKSASANTVSYFLFLVGVALEVVIVLRLPGLEAVQGFPYMSYHPPSLRVLMSFFPPCLLALGLKQLGDTAIYPHSDWQPVTLRSANICPVGDPGCTLTPGDIFVWLTCLSFLYFVLALYLDKVLPDANGMRHHPLFFLGFKIRGKRGRGKGRKKHSIHPLGAPEQGERRREDVDMDMDVAAERAHILREMQEEEQKAWKEGGEGGKEGGGGAQDKSVAALSVRGLEKEFQGMRMGLLGKRGKPHRAVQCTWFQVPQGTLFCLLGPNGAGKSTTINCLTGVTRASGGDALIYGHTIRSTQSMSHIQKSMGLCPQFDVLWGQLSGAEHLSLFAQIRGIFPKNIPKEVDHLLGEVHLREARSVRSSSYSGGMRRRLSVAVALIGNPRIVFLDEPTTGMDPVSRRHVWNIIERAKRGRAVVLTTHSMEEADILGDRIAIMAKGRLRCIGTSIHLKQRFGSGIVVRVGLEPQLQQQRLLTAAPREDSDAESGEEEELDQFKRREDTELRLFRDRAEEEETVARAVSKKRRGRGAASGAVMVPRAHTLDGAFLEESLQSRKAIRRFFKKRLGLKPVEETREWVSFCIPNDDDSEQSGTDAKAPGLRKRCKVKGAKAKPKKETLSTAEFFKKLNRTKEKLGVGQIQLSLTTLEEVFLNIARLAELETAAAEGRYEDLVLRTGLTVKVPIGAELVRLPRIDLSSGLADDGEEGAGTGEKVSRPQWQMRIEWQQDEAGFLHIARHSKPVLEGTEEGSPTEEEEDAWEEYMSMRPAQASCTTCLPPNPLGFIGFSRAGDVVTADQVQHTRGRK